MTAINLRAGGLAVVAYRMVIAEGSVFWFVRFYWEVEEGVGE